MMKLGIWQCWKQKTLRLKWTDWANWLYYDDTPVWIWMIVIVPSLVSFKCLGLNDITGTVTIIVDIFAIERTM